MWYILIDIIQRKKITMNHQRPIYLRTIALWYSERKHQNCIRLKVYDISNCSNSQANMMMKVTLSI